jgi:aminoglycoside phosphotransferase (APT) family kinase protein
VTDWLVELAAEGHRPHVDDWRSRLVEAPLASFARSPDARDTLPHIPRVHALLDRLHDLPSVPEQRDLGPWNLLLGDDGRLLVLDWESAEPNGLPLLDLVYFLTYASFFLDDALHSGRVVDSYARSLDPITATGRVVAACERRYVERLGLDPALISPLRALAWISHSSSERARRRLDPHGAGGAAHAPVFPRLLVAELNRACSWWTVPVRTP